MCRALPRQHNTGAAHGVLDKHGLLLHSTSFGHVSSEQGTEPVAICVCLCVCACLLACVQGDRIARLDSHTLLCVIWALGYHCLGVHHATPAPGQPPKPAGTTARVSPTLHIATTPPPEYILTQVTSRLATLLGAKGKQTAAFTATQVRRTTQRATLCRADCFSAGLKHSAFAWRWHGCMCWEQVALRVQI